MEKHWVESNHLKYVDFIQGGDKFVRYLCDTMIRGCDNYGDGEDYNSHYCCLAGTANPAPVPTYTGTLCRSTRLR